LADAPDPLTASLADLYERLLRDEEARPWLDPGRAVDLLRPAQQPPPPAHTARSLWTAAHMALLHLPSSQSDTWRSRLRACVVEAEWPQGRPSREQDRSEAPDDPGVIVPALSGQWEEKLVAWPRAAAQLPSFVPDVLAEAVSGEEPSLQARMRRHQWAVRATHVLRLIELDPYLVFFRKTRVQWPIRRDYVEDELVKCLDNLRHADVSGSAKDRFLEAYKLDALIGSVVRPTPPAPDSWWSRWRAAPWPDLAVTAADGGYELHCDPERLATHKDVEQYSGGELPNLTGLARSGKSPVQYVLSAFARELNPADAARAALGVAVVQPSGTTRAAR
jgi:hypothetical protein